MKKVETTITGMSVLLPNSWKLRYLSLKLGTFKKSISLLLSYWLSEAAGEVLFERQGPPCLCL